MGQEEKGRYDRSRYGSNADDRAASGRYHDSFFEDMLITDEELDRTFGPLDGAKEAVEDTGGDAQDSEGEPLLSDDASAEVEGGLRDGEDGRSAAEDAAGNRRTRERGDQDERPGVASRASRGDADDVATQSERAEAAAGVSRSGADRVSEMYSRKAVESRVAESASNKQPRAKRRRIGLAGRIAAVVALVVVLVGAGFALAYVSGVSGNLHAGVDDDLRAALAKTDMANEPFYMLLLGTDGSSYRDEDPNYGGGYRSDSMMLARIDPVQKKATLISVGRDIQVDLGEHGKQKINAAYAFGGPALAVKAVSELAGVPISHYAQVDFDGFGLMVDALGGVEVDVPMAIVNDVDAGGSVPAGLQTLDGNYALILCRARNSFADISAHPDEMRAANQRLVLSAIARKVLSSDIPTIASTVKAMSSYVTTDLEVTDIIGLAQIMKGLNPDTDLYTGSVPTTSEYVNDTWYEFVDKDAWKTMMDRVKAGEPPVEEAIIDEATGVVLATSGAGATSTADKYATVTVKNATDITGLASKVRSKLSEAGFVNVVVGDITDNFSYPETLVVYDEPGRAREAEEIVSVIGQGKAMKNDGSYLLMGTDFLVVIGDDWDTSKS